MTPDQEKEVLARVMEDVSALAYEQMREYGIGFFTEGCFGTEKAEFIPVRNVTGDDFETFLHLETGEVIKITAQFHRS